MKKLISKRWMIIVLSLVSTFSSAQTNGPWVDTIFFNGKSQEDLGLMDVASGKSDIWNYGTPGSVFQRLPEDVKSKLEVYSVSGASYMGLMLNPFPNQAPYLSDSGSDVTGKAQFNPLAIQKVRYALNWLINRQKVVDEILGGAGIAQFTPVVPGLPNSSRFDAIAAKLGMTAAGSEAKALSDISLAMTEAAALPALKGRLVKTNPWWTFDGRPVTLKFVIRADDPNSRLPLGRYIASQIEKSGIQVERLEWDRTKASTTVNRTDPRSLQWSLYTEGLGSNETKAFWEMTMAYMYAPWASIMPGGNNEAFWNYKNAEIDRLTTSVVNGGIKNAQEYWANLLSATTLGMKDSVRILVAAKTSSLAAAKDRFTTRMAYGLGDGLNKWSLYTANLKPETSGPEAGKKVLRMTGFSSRGALFMNAWDPVGTQGFGDTYSGAVIKPVSDLELETNPATGIPMSVRATWTNLKTGNVPSAVPPEAVTWNQNAQKWEPVRGSQAVSQGTFTFKFGAWHHGRPVDQNDYRYALAFPYGITDASYFSAVKSRLARTKGYLFAKDGSITVWSDAKFPLEEAQLAAMMVPTLQVGAVNSGAVVPWEILEALRSVVYEGNASGTIWSFTSDALSTEVDLLNLKLLSDLKAKLKEFILAKKVPAALSGFLSPNQAGKNYQLTLNWLDQHGHGYISNGAFYLDRYDGANNTGTLRAFRDKSYPFGPEYWTNALKMDFTQIDAIRVEDPKKGQDLRVVVTVSQIAYPAVLGIPSSQAKVSVSISVGDEIWTVAAKKAQPGVYEALFSAEKIEGLNSGSYSVVAESSLGKSDSPSVASSLLLKF